MCSCGKLGVVFRGNNENEVASVINEDVTDVSLPNYDTFEA